MPPLRWFWHSCRMIFFLQIHIKNACDGSDGTVKRYVARASLQRPVNNQILPAKAYVWFLCQRVGIYRVWVFTGSGSGSGFAILAESGSGAGTGTGSVIIFFVRCDTATFGARCTCSSYSSCYIPDCRVRPPGRPAVGEINGRARGASPAVGEFIRR